MNEFEQEKQRELDILDDTLNSLQQKVEIAINKEGTDRTKIFSAGIAKYIELKFNKVMLEEGFNTELEEHMFIPLAVLSWYILKETESIEGLYKEYGAGELPIDELTIKIDEHVSNIIDARLGMLKLGKLDA